MNKSEIQARIEKCKSEIASLKADLAKCEEGIEQEKCWHVINDRGETGWESQTKEVADEILAINKHLKRAAYMPECRQVTADDVRGVWKGFDGTMSHDEFAKRAHKLGFRIKVTP